MLLSESKIDTVANKLGTELFLIFKDAVLKDVFSKQGQYILLDTHQIPLAYFENVLDKMLSAGYIAGMYLKFSVLLHPLSKQMLSTFPPNVIDSILKDGVYHDVGALVKIGGRRNDLDFQIDVTDSVFVLKNDDSYKTALMNKMQFLSHELKSAIRHELEHLFQSMDVWDTADINKNIISDEILYVMNYYESKAEIEAFVTQAHHIAKSKKIPLQKVLVSMINSRPRQQLLTYNAPEDLVDEFCYRLLDKWVAYAKKRFPHAL